MTTPWQTRAACAARPELPWLVDSDSVTAWQAETMRAVCGDCPVVFDCLAAVDDLDITGGWWAGADRDPDAAPPAAPPDFVEWVPIRSRRRGGWVAEQAVFDFDALAGVGGAA